MDNRNYNLSIGKNVIESLTLGMYEDPRFIFREYIQNSADQIDKAIAEGLLDEDQGEIHIDIDTEEKTITIEDNATGIPEKKVLSVLLDIAASTKEIGKDKGFRGIGRLGGLAYCDKLIFETSFKGEKTKSILIWDALLLKDIINNRKSKEDAVAVINRITNYDTSSEKADEHYFKVTLENVTNFALLDKASVEDYLSMVAPIPFPTNFRFKNQIYKELQKEGIHLDEYKIFLNTEQLFKGYTTSIYDKKEDATKSKADELIDILFFREVDKQGNLLYWGWHGVSTFNRQMSSVNKARGLRLRKANIQIGDEHALLKLHRERRFNSYFFGEIHAISNQLIPNARRDYFTENDVYREFEKKLKSWFHTYIYTLCRQASDINGAVKKIQDLHDMQEEYKQKQQDGFSDQSENKQFREKFESKKEDALKAAKKLEKLGNGTDEIHTNAVRAILNKVAPISATKKVETIELPTNRKPKLRINHIPGLKKDEKKLLGKVFGVIRDVLDPGMAENLIQKIEEEI